MKKNLHKKIFTGLLGTTLTMGTLLGASFSANASTQESKAEKSITNVDTRENKATGTINVPDKNLLICLNREIGRILNTSRPSNQAITQEDIDSLNNHPDAAMNSIHCEKMGIVNIEGIQYFGGMPLIMLDHNSIVNISPLSKMESTNGVYISVVNQNLDFHAKYGDAYTDVLYPNLIVLHDKTPATLTAYDTSLVTIKTDNTGFTFNAPGEIQIGLNGANGTANDNVHYSFNSKINYNVKKFDNIVPDDALRACINATINPNPLLRPTASPITEEAAQQVNSVLCPSRGIESIEGLDKFTNLTYINLKSNNIKSIEPLRAISPNLTGTVLLDSNHISDLSPLQETSEFTFVWASDQTIELEDTDTHINQDNPVKNIDGTLHKLIAHYPNVKLLDGNAGWYFDAPGTYTLSWDSEGDTYYFDGIITQKAR